MASPLNWISQIGSMSRFALQTIPQRRGASFAAAFGIAGVVGVLVGVLSIQQGFERAMTAGGSPTTALVMRKGADTEMSSILTGEDARVLADGAGIVRGPEGPLISSELFVIISLPKRTTGSDANVPLRGVTQGAFGIRPGFKVVEGRRFEPGRNELMVGAGAAAAFAGLDVGSALRIEGVDWQVVGRFTAGGGMAESEIWCDAAVLQPAYQRGNTYQSVYAKLSSAEAYRRFKDALTSDPRLKVGVQTEAEYLSEKSKMVSTIITALGSSVAAMMALGAIFGALNTMYNAVAARTREIATLRALGFSAGPVVISILAESICLALIGGIIGAACSYLAFNGYRTATINWQTFSQVTFAFQVTPQLLVTGIVLAVFIGVVGGLFPAIRAIRLPIAAALREL